MGAPTQLNEDGLVGGSLLKLAFLSTGVWVSFVAFGWAQETLTSHRYGPNKDRFTHTSSLVLVQSVGNAVVGYIALKLTQGWKVSITGGVPVREWLLTSLAYLGAHKFGLEALRYIIFPLQVVCKSCKSIPVMLGERLLAGQTHSTEKKISVILLTLGVVVFTLAQPKKKDDEFHLDAKTIFGLTLVFLALICDGIYGPYQNKIAKEYKVTEYHLMLNMNLWQALFATVLILPSGARPRGGAAASGLEHAHAALSRRPCAAPPARSRLAGELAELSKFVVTHPSVLQEMAIFSATMAAGNLFIFKLQHDFGALTVTKVTTIRKLVSVLFSVLWFRHSMAKTQWIGVFIVFFANQIAKYTCKAVGIKPPPKKADKGKKESKKSK